MLYDLNPRSGVNVVEDIRGPKTTTTVSATATASVILPANSNRAVYSIYNAGNTTVFLREGSTVSSTVFEVPLHPGFMWKEDFSNSPRYLGAISGITATGTSSLLVSEAVLN
ncbi:MAG: hypothetical protein ACBR12_26095 [Microcoleus sp.]|uniref:hypothetical protein n=1 Tax=Microcoleus sp. CAWBG640 TaxID=2841653 RepID=UPI00312B2EE1